VIGKRRLAIAFQVAFTMRRSSLEGCHSAPALQLGDQPHAEDGDGLLASHACYHPVFWPGTACLFTPINQALPNRRHTNGNHHGGEVLRQLVAFLNPNQLIAVGVSAQTALQRLGIAAIPIRHPGHGGAKTFEAGMQEIFGERAGPVGLLGPVEITGPITYSGWRNNRL
jgi:hypothetical protein